MASNSNNVYKTMDVGGERRGQYFAHNYAAFKYHDEFHKALTDETKAMDTRLDAGEEFQTEKHIAEKLHKLARGRMKAWKHEDKPRMRKHIKGWYAELHTLNLDNMIDACYTISAFMIKRDKNAGPRQRRKGMESVKLLSLLKKYFLIRKANYKKAIKVQSYSHNEDSVTARKHMKDFTKLGKDLVQAKDALEAYLKQPAELCFPETKEENGFSVSDMLHCVGEPAGLMMYGLEHIYKTCSVYVSVASLVRTARPVNLNRREVKRGERSGHDGDLSSPMAAIMGCFPLPNDL